MTTTNIIVVCSDNVDAARAILKELNKNGDIAENIVEHVDNPAEVIKDKCVDGMLIRHKAKGTNDYWYATWNKEDNQYVAN